MKSTLYFCQFPISSDLFSGVKGRSSAVRVWVYSPYTVISTIDAAAPIGKDLSQSVELPVVLKASTDIGKVLGKSVSSRANVVCASEPIANQFNERNLWRLLRVRANRKIPVDQRFIQSV